MTMAFARTTVILLHIALSIAAIFAAIATAKAQDATPVVKLPVPTFADVAYGSDERHKLDLWQAAGAGARPLVVFIHGGGWHGGDKGDVPPKLVALLLEHGISVASINYRFTKTARAPAPLYDAARAVRYLRTKAGEWKLDPAHFGGYGISAGGVSVLWLTYHDDLTDPKNADPVLRQSSRLQAAVGLSPPLCLEAPEIAKWIGPEVLKHPMIARAVGAGSGEEVVARYEEFGPLLHECSPLTHVSRDDPAVLLSFPRIDPLPATTPGSAIHHAVFGQKLKERTDSLGIGCILRIEDRAAPDQPTPEEFLLRQLKP
ncbi:MAG: lipase [Pirellula sp.]|nr:lipase [Pirellula sp.]